MLLVKETGLLPGYARGVSIDNPVRAGDVYMMFSSGKRTKRWAVSSMTQLSCQPRDTPLMLIIRRGCLDAEHATVIREMQDPLDSHLFQQHLDE